jgi:hypothetical protein
MNSEATNWPPSAWRRFAERGAKPRSFPPLLCPQSRELICRENKGIDRRHLVAGEQVVMTSAWFPQTDPQFACGQIVPLALHSE